MYSLGEVVVRAAGEGVVESAGTVVTVDAAEIRMRGARTLEEALALIPGLFVRAGGDGTPRVDIRGFRTRHVLLLLDGTPFNATYDGQFDPTFIPVEDIAEIRVTTGGSSVLYGQGGNGGVINIITKKGRAGFHTYMAAEGGEGDSYLGKAAVSAGAGPLDVFASGSRYGLRGFRLSDDFTPTPDENGGLRENSDRKRTNIFANVGFTPTDDTMVGFTVSHLSGEFGKPPVTNFSPSDPFSSNLKFDRMDDMDGTNLQLAASHRFDTVFSARGWAYFNRLDSLENRYDDATYTTQGPGTFSEDSSTTISGVNLQGSADMGAYGRATIALMFENDGWESNGFKINNKGKLTDIDLDRNFQVYSVAAEYEINPVNGLGLVAGYGHHFQERQDAPDDDDFSYLVGAYYDVLDGTRLRVSHERKVRFPSLKQLYEVDAGNTGLKAERSMHYEAGLEQALPANTLVTLTGFYTDISDFIEKDDTTGLNTNFQKYIFEGVEVTAENRTVQGLMVRAAYSYLYTRDLTTGGVRGELQYRPRHKVTVDTGYRFDFGLTAYASFAYVATQSFYNAAGDRKELKDFGLVDAKLSQDILGDRVNLYIGARNLLDRDYEQSYGLPQAGRTVYGGVEVRL